MTANFDAEPKRLFWCTVNPTVCLSTVTLPGFERFVDSRGWGEAARASVSDFRPCFTTALRRNTGSLEARMKSSTCDTRPIRSSATRSRRAGRSVVNMEICSKNMTDDHISSLLCLYMCVRARWVSPCSLRCMRRTSCSDTMRGGCWTSATPSSLPCPNL